MRLDSRAVLSALLALVLLTGGCSAIKDYFRQRPQALLPAGDLYAQGEKELDKSRYEDARAAFKKIVERHPQSTYAPRARFLIGEAYFREAEWDKAIKEFEAFLAFYPRHQIADLVQFRLAMSYYDQMKPVEQDQGIAAKAMEAFKKLLREYPESRYAADALSKIDICRGRLAQKELWVASYYFNQGNPAAGRQRLENVIKDYPRTLVIPEALYRLGEVYASEGKGPEALVAFRRVATEYSYTEWGRRAAQRVKSMATR
jgi:outer membrane protein assembly factor BamD